MQDFEEYQVLDWLALKADTYKPKLQGERKCTVFFLVFVFHMSETSPVIINRVTEKM